MAFLKMSKGQLLYLADALVRVWQLLSAGQSCCIHLFGTQKVDAHKQLPYYLEHVSLCRFFSLPLKKESEMCRRIFTGWILAAMEQDSVPFSFNCLHLFYQLSLMFLTCFAR